MFIMADEILQILQHFNRDSLEQGRVSMLRFQEGVNFLWKKKTFS